MKLESIPRTKQKSNPSSSFSTRTSFLLSNDLLLDLLLDLSSGSSVRGGNPFEVLDGGLDVAHFGLRNQNTGKSA